MEYGMGMSRPKLDCMQLKTVPKSMEISNLAFLSGMTGIEFPLLEQINGWIYLGICLGFNPCLNAPLNHVMAEYIFISLKMPYWTTISISSIGQQ